MASQARPSSSMGRMFARATFLPSLALNLVLERVTTRCWYTAVDPNVILGALPFKTMTQELVQRCGVRAVVSMNEDYELRYLSNSPEEWSAAGVDFLQLSTTDMFEAPSQDKLKRGVQFILRHSQPQNVTRQQRPQNVTQQQLLPNNAVAFSALAGGATIANTTTTTTTSHVVGPDHGATGGSDEGTGGARVYVHCKAGRTRSATLVACYLMQAYGMSPDEAVSLLHQRRPHVWLGRQQHAAIREYHQHLLGEWGGGDVAAAGEQQ